MPSVPGMRTSMRTTSGRTRPTCATASSPVAGLTGDHEVGLGLQDHPEAGADEHLVVDDEHADHSTSSGISARSS